ncbi:unnamed protein product [Cylindrotheca closterium]|uniref:Uncharacterized protein n=1 Tax=Cylindrotheca closterium TaxID=2856 RepID=A0AAD2JMU9_9STRA|nr:unnamed protein product [Cylindrotheca closterium]
MPSQTFLSKSFAPSGRYDIRGSIADLPFDGKLNHHLALDKKCPTLKNLQGSCGFPALNVIHGQRLYRVTCPEDFWSTKDRMVELEKEFDAWNAPGLTKHQRLMLCETKPPGFALVVCNGADDKPCHLCFLSTPVLTKSNMNERSGFSAPVLADIFDDAVLQHFECLNRVGEPNHVMLGSFCGTTFGVPPDEGRPAFTEALLPVIMSDGKAIGQKPLNGNSWKILIFPHMSKCLN